MSLVLKLAHQLRHDLSICFTSESYIRKIFVFYFRVVINDSVMNEVYFFVLITVRMTISLIYLSTSCPTSMSNSYCRLNRFICELLYQSLDAVKTGRTISFLRKLSQHFPDSVVFFRKRYDTGTVVPSVFE